ncbi:MAG: hypothetical protein WB870_05090 [Gallionellaceae bacterium]
MKGLISFVVDGIAAHYYKAELFLFSLEKFAGVPRNRILVQCVDRVSQDFLAFLRHHGYTYRLVSPFLDGKYCNKLQQLEGIETYLADSDGVYLLDIDMAVLAPFAIPDNQAICGKIVDQPNPPLHVLERIFTTANIGLPESVSCDCDQGKTLSTNFNGGFLFIPRDIIKVVSDEWRSLASWLFQRPELFDNTQQFIHVDQVAMSMAIASRSLNVVRVPTNYNFPLNQKIRPAYFLPDQPIRILHYHDQINPFGMIFSAFSDGGALDKSLASFNAALAGHGQFTFFDAYKRQQAKSALQMAAPSRDGALHQVFSNHKLHELPRRRLILHAGTPKTGTTSLQFHLDENRPMLKSHGMLYPSIRNKTNSAVPKHQWLMECLLSGDEAPLAGEMNAVVGELAPNIHTIILSTEGIFNHWWDFPPASKALLASLTNWFDVEVWVWFREPALFMKSSYLQKLCNPRTPMVRSNGIDLSMEEMLQDAWIVKHLDYLGFIREAQAIFGKNSVAAFQYDGNTVASAMKFLGLTSPQQKEEQRHNVSLGEMGVNLIRVANRYDLNSFEKEQVVILIKQIDALVAKKCGPYILDDTSRERIKACFALQENILQDEFGLSWAPQPGKLASHPAETVHAQARFAKPSGYTRFF